MGDVPDLPVVRLTEEGLRRRLASGELEPADTAALERAKRLRALRSAGRTFEECAQEMGENPKSLSTFSRSRAFGVLSEYLERGELEVIGQSTERVVKQARADLAQLAPKVVRLYEECLERDADGNFLSKADAQWAADRIAKGTGLTDSGASARPIVVVPIADIKRALRNIRDDDEAIVVEATPVAGSRSQSSITAETPGSPTPQSGGADA